MRYQVQLLYMCFNNILFVIKQHWYIILFSGKMEEQEGNTWSRANFQEIRADFVERQNKKIAAL